ncbi:MAG: HAD family hydrolase [bacterium]|nr:HAD family hydrolase [bacterium]
MQEKSDNLKKAVFLDRDGVVIELAAGNQMHSFILTEEACHIIKGVPEALKTLKERGYKIFVITNQPAVARGIVGPETVDALHTYINKQLGGLIDGFYWCPHHPESHHPDIPAHAMKYRIKCDCRKPLPGLLIRAAHDFNIDLKKSWMIGDMITDIAAGAAAGCKTILVKSYLNERVIVPVVEFNRDIKPNYQTENLESALQFIDSTNSLQVD